MEGIRSSKRRLRWRKLCDPDSNKGQLVDVVDQRWPSAKGHLEELKNYSAKDFIWAQRQSSASRQTDALRNEQPYAQ
jgi:hypothetical protein